jgi:hypothetical protein
MMLHLAGPERSHNVPRRVVNNPIERTRNY